jgi:hypothetical protein
MKRTGGVAVAVAVSMWLWDGRAGAEPRTHDGFQFRGALGVGYLSDSESLSDSSFSATISGVGLGLDLYFGGTPARGLTIGGFVNATTAVGPSLSVNGKSLGSASNDVSLGLGLIGPYLDYYPDPTSGLHVLALAGLASLSVSDGSGSSQQSGSGFGVGAGVGYDVWIGDEWSLGILGRLQYASTKLDSGGVTATDNVIAPAVLASIVYQ